MQILHYFDWPHRGVQVWPDLDRRAGPAPGSSLVVMFPEPFLPLCGGSGKGFDVGMVLDPRILPARYIAQCPAVARIDFQRMGRGRRCNGFEAKADYVRLEEMLRSGKPAA